MNLCVEKTTQEEQVNLLESLNLGYFQRIRNISQISSSNASSGALIKETYAVFSAVSRGLPLSNIRTSILKAQTVQKAAYTTRQKVWNAISHRYLSAYPEWLGLSLANATQQGMYSRDYLSLAYLYFALRDRLVFGFVTQVIWDKWQQRTTNVSRGDVLDFLLEQAEEFPQVARWRQSTRTKLAANILSALRDFGLLKGKQRKYIQHPTIESEAVYHLLCILLAEGKQGRSILETADWRLFLWSEAEVVNALVNLAQKRWIRFEKGGRTVILELIRMPEVLA